MIEFDPFVEAIDAAESHSKMELIEDLIESIDNGSVYPFKLYESGDKERTLSHFAFNALGKVLKFVDSDEDYFTKSKVNQEAERKKENERKRKPISRAVQPPHPRFCKSRDIRRRLGSGAKLAEIDGEEEKRSPTKVPVVVVVVPVDSSSIETWELPFQAADSDSSIHLYWL